MSDITTLASFYTEVTRLMDGEDPTVSDVSVDSLNRLLRVAQRRIYRHMRTRYNEKAFAGVVSTGNLAPIPADFEAGSDLQVGGVSLEPVPRQVLDQYQQDYVGNSGKPQKFTRVGSAFSFWPALTDGTAINGTYYARLPDLTDSSIATNALFQVADDLFIFGCLVESATFFGADKRMQVWEAKYQSIKSDLNRSDMRAAYSVGRAKRTSSTRILK